MRLRPGSSRGKQKACPEIADAAFLHGVLATYLQSTLLAELEPAILLFFKEFSVFEPVSRLSPLYFELKVSGGHLCVNTCWILLLIVIFCQANWNAASVLLTSFALPFLVWLLIFNALTCSLSCDSCRKIDG